MAANNNRGAPILLILIVLAFIWWLYKKRGSTQNVAQIQQVTPSSSYASYSSMSTNPTPPPTTSEGGETLTFEFTNLTDQTFTHNLGRLVDVTTIVGGEEVELNVLYPDLNTVRIQSNTAITGTLIVQ
ncbi:hypothetical protein [Runella limosa]|uniref:hypothetical protein n=1 Tax=Runella limosa TaxID=370978 RepID=UPI00048DC877|nr:hypothetical protein [Runella limosa]